MGRVTTKTTGRALRRFVRKTQASDWEALDQALRDAIDGVWSMAASNLAARIVAAARLVGPTPPKSVPWRLVSGGVYDAVLDVGEVPHASLTPEFVAETDARMAEVWTRRPGRGAPLRPDRRGDPLAGGERLDQQRRPVMLLPVDDERYEVEQTYLDPPRRYMPRCGTRRSSRGS